MTVELNNNELQVQRLKEIIRYRKDPISFLKEQCKIRHPRKGIIPFTLFPAQEKCIENFRNHRFNVVLKSRQLGITTIVAGYCCWRMIFFPHQEIRVVATKNETAQISIEMANTMVDNVEPWILSILGAVRATERKHTVELLNGSRMQAFGQARGSTPDTGVGRALSLLVVDEAALIPNMEDIWTSVYPTLSQGGDCIVLSCVTKDTFIITDKGIKQISDFIQSDKKGGYVIDEYKVLGHNNVRSGNLFKNNGLVNTRIIETQFSELEGSLNHKLFTFKNNKFDWQELKDLNKGDWIAIEYGKEIWGNNDNVSDFKPNDLNIQDNNNNIFNPNIINEDLAYFLGLILANGFMNKQDIDEEFITITFNNSDIDITNILEKNNFKYFIYKEKNRNYVHYKIFSKSLIEFLEYLGFDLLLNTKNRIIPKRLFEMSRNNIIQMIKGFMDAKGFSNDINGTIELKLTSKEMIKQFRMLFLNFGILTNLNYEHTIFVDEYNSKIYYEKIGFRTQKQKNYSIVKSIQYNSTEDFISNKNELTEDLLNSNIKWCKIQNIKESQNETFDFSLPETNDFWCHSILYNGFIGHQTPRGTSNWFYNTYRKAEDKDYQEGEIPFHPIRLMWWENTERMDTPLVPDPSVPGGYTNQWSKATFAALSTKQIAQEYSCLSGDTYVMIQDKWGKKYKITIEQLINFMS